LAVARAKQAASFDRVTVDPVTRRKLKILKKALSLPAPDRPGASEDMAKIKVDLKSQLQNWDGAVNYWVLRADF
jgi:peptidyl-dipeptidase A